MKIYTEEQVIKALELSKTVGWGEKGMEYIYSDNEILERLTPIELPSDEDAGVIALNIASTLKDGLDSREEAFYLAGFQTCAKWMRDKILNK